jgi:hypothetical protein
VILTRKVKLEVKLEVVEFEEGSRRIGFHDLKLLEITRFNQVSTGSSNNSP